MDIRKTEKQASKTESKSEYKRDEYKPYYEPGMISSADAKLMLPPVIQGKLHTLTQKYGIPFDLSNIGLDGKMAENVKALRTIVDMVEGDSKLLPEMLKLIKRLMKAEIKLAQFHRGVTTAAIKHQEKIDKYTADIFLKMAKYEQKATKREHRTNTRNKLIEKRTAAYADYYQNTVYGEESKLIDVEFETLTSNKKILADSKTEKLKLDEGRKQKINQYVQSAFS